jgi:hypothetical protein
MKGNEMDIKKYVRYANVMGYVVLLLDLAFVLVLVWNGATGIQFLPVWILCLPTALVGYDLAMIGR